MILFAMCMVGCGGGDKPAEKKEATADKALLAYAELLATGETANEVGLSKEEQAEISGNLTKDFVLLGELIEIPMSEQSAKAIADKYHENVKGKVKFSATIKKDDPEHPVVEFKVTPIDSSNATTDFKPLMDMKEKLQQDGATNEQLQNNADFQKLAVETITKNYDKITVKDEQTFEVTCNKVNGHWAPENLITFKKLFM